MEEPLDRERRKCLRRRTNMEVGRGHSLPVIRSTPRQKRMSGIECDRVLSTQHEDSGKDREPPFSERRQGGLRSVLLKEVFHRLGVWRGERSGIRCMPGRHSSQAQKSTTGSHTVLSAVPCTVHLDCPILLVGAPTRETVFLLTVLGDRKKIEPKNP